MKDKVEALLKENEKLKNEVLILNRTLRIIKDMNPEISIISSYQQAEKELKNE